MIFFRYIQHSWPRFPPVTRLFSFNLKHGLWWRGLPPVKSTQWVLWSVFPVCLCFINPWSRIAAFWTLPPSKLIGPMSSFIWQTKMVKVETGCGLTKAHQYHFINLPEKWGFSGLTFLKSGLVRDHILTSHAGDSIWSSLVINSRSAIKATNEFPQEDLQISQWLER